MATNFHVGHVCVFGRDLDGRLGDCQAEARRDDRNDSRAGDLRIQSITLGYNRLVCSETHGFAGTEKDFRGQASLALSGWIALLCFAVAMALPTAWPWSVIRM